MVARDLGREEIVLNDFSSTIILGMLDNPSTAWNSVVNDAIDDAQQLDSLKLIMSEWKEQEGFDVLLHARALFPDTADLSVLSELIEGVVGSQLEDAFTYLQGLSREARGDLPSALVLVAARIDPQLALQQIAAWSDDPIFLQLQKTVANTWARTNPRSMLDSLASLPQGTRLDAMKIAFTHLAFVSPEEAIQYLDIAKNFLGSEVTLA